MCVVLLVVLSLLMTSLSAFAQTLEQQERNKAVEKAFRDLDRAKSYFESASKEAKFQCIASIGDERFCECIVRNMPGGINFVDYVGLVSQSKQELRYDSRSIDERRLIDTARLARETCAKRR